MSSVPSVNFNFSNTTVLYDPTVVEETVLSIEQFMHDYCNQMDINVIIYLVGFWFVNFFLLLAYKREWIDKDRYADLSNRVQLIYFMTCFVLLFYLLLRNYGVPSWLSALIA